MRITLNINDEALAEALEAAPGFTKTAVINEALREFAHRRRVGGLRDFTDCGPWEGNLDALRERR